MLAWDSRSVEEQAGEDDREEDFDFERVGRREVCWEEGVLLKRPVSQRIVFVVDFGLLERLERGKASKEEGRG